MKLSAYWKEQGFETELLLDYSQVGEYDRLYVSKVFTDTFVPEHILTRETTLYGGTGFFYDKAPVLPEAIEHHTPDYHLYDRMVNDNSTGKKQKKEFEFYTDYSIGFLTRGCFRKCSFCVNQNSSGVVAASPLEEFYDPSRKKLCFLDDNFFAYAGWEKIFSSVLETGRRFQFRQGLDLRIMQKKQIELLASGKLDNGMVFAFDHIKDKELIERKLELLREVIPISYHKVKLYVLCGYDWDGTWLPDFWAADIRDVFERIKILMQYGCLAYLMRYEAWLRAPETYKGMYINLSRWCNQPAQYVKKSLREFCTGQGENSSSFRYLAAFEALHPEMSHYLDMKYEEVQHGKIYV
jgi:hypothetical protein